MHKMIDAAGKACPIPVILAKKEIDAGTGLFTIKVDNDIAVQNLQRLAESQGYAQSVQEAGGLFTVFFFKKGITAPQQAADQEADLSNQTVLDRQSREAAWALFIGKDVIGAGDETLGASLIRMFFLYIITDGKFAAVDLVYE